MPAVDTVTTFDELSGASPAAEASERMRSEHVHLPPRTYVLSQYERIAFRTCADHAVRMVCGLLCVNGGRSRLAFPPDYPLV